MMVTDPTRPDMTILELMDNPRLLAPFLTRFQGEVWRSLLMAAFALGMTEDALEAFRLCTGRQTAPTTPFREIIIICGRRSGKSFVLAIIAIYLAVIRNYEGLLAIGEVASVAIIASDRKQARTITRYVSGMLNGVPAFKRLIKQPETDESITLKNRVVIEIMTASFRGTRSYTYAAVLGDEVCFWRDSETSANPDEEILRAVRFGLATIPGSMLVLASSPYARRGAVYTAFRKHYGIDDAKVLVWKAPSWTMNPTLDQDFIDEAYASDPVAAAAELGSDFRSDVETYVAREAVEACVIPGLLERARMLRTPHVAFVDCAGGSGSDSMTMAISHKEGSKAVLDHISEVKPPFSPEQIVERFCGVLKSYGVNKVVGDRYAGEWPREQFRKFNVAYEPSARPKSALYQDFLAILNSKAVELLDNPTLVNQLINLERRTARGGKPSIDHAPAGHDDVVNSCVGSLLEASGKYDILAEFKAVNQGMDWFLGQLTGRQNNPYFRG